MEEIFFRFLVFLIFIVGTCKRDVRFGVLLHYSTRMNGCELQFAFLSTTKGQEFGDLIRKQDNFKCFYSIPMMTG